MAGLTGLVGWVKLPAMKTISRWSVGLVMALAAWLPVTRGADEPKLDPQARKVVEAVAAHLRGLQGVRVNVTLTQLMQADEQKQERVTTYALTGQRPNKLRLVLGGVMALTVLSDGKQAYTVVPSLQKYTVDEAPASWEAVLADNGVGMMAGGPGYRILKDLLSGDPAKELLSGVTNLTYVGTEELAGVKCHRLQFVQAEGKLDAWIVDGAQPWVRQVEFDLSEVVARLRAQRPEVKEAKASLTVSLADWAENPAWKDDSFVFQAPEGVVLAETLFPDTPSAEHAKLLGQPAPSFKLKQLDGTEIEVGAGKEKGVVVLDFWATWCGPCRVGLPILSEVVGGYKAGEVKFYAVNEEESAAAVQTFLTKSGLKLNVLLDADGKVGALYNVNGIPQTVLIGPNGTVQAIHVGVAPDLKRRLRKQLDTLVAGQALVAPPAAGKAD